ncbi:MAG TPA: hypothetical protein DCM40_07415, partial [Maribacter sp.]|nr:hypothetical protein [Maribacter sp.]
DVPYIYEDRISKESFLDAIISFYNMSQKDKDAMGKAGREHVLKNYNLDQYATLWREVFKDVEENMGSWENRK